MESSWSPPVWRQHLVLLRNVGIVRGSVQKQNRPGGDVMLGHVEMQALRDAPWHRPADAAQHLEDREGDAFLLVHQV